MDSCKAMTDQNAFEVETKKHEDDSTLDYTITTAFELLDTSIQDGSKSLEKLTSGFNRVITLMEEVGFKEKAAEQAKKEAATSSLDILAKVDELKQAHQRAKETNDMLAREVYVQKESLAKDIKDLQIRLSGVLDGRDGYLGVVDEMSSVLEMRLTTAVRERVSADKEKLKKEMLAQQALAFEECQMLKLVENSKRLKLEEEKNSKLQDLFKERELAVNILHGDITDKYLDINSFRERLHQPALQVSSSQTPSCLTSSGSSLTCILERELELQLESTGTLKETYGEHGQSVLPNKMLPQKEEGNKNGLLDVKSPLVDADINEVGYSMSTEDSVASAKTNAINTPFTAKHFHTVRNGVSLLSHPRRPNGP